MRPANTRKWQPLVLAGAGKGPLYRQVYETLRAAIVDGTLGPGQQIPPSRALAEQLQLSRNTVNAAYEMLLSEGYISSRPGAGYFVALLNPDEATTATPTAQAPGPKRSSRGVSRRGAILAKASRPVAKIAGAAFQRGYPALDEFPFRAWQQQVDRHLRHPSEALLRYQDDGGLQSLKVALMEYLRLARGVHCGADQVVIVSGGQAALDLISRLLVDEGDRVAIEEPGYLGARDALLAAGADLVPVPVDDDGLCVDALNGRDIRLAYVTPSYQFPMGVTLDATRRLQMLKWAQDEDAYVIEDDYDSEFRYRGRPLSSMQGIDRGGRVIYLGTFSKVMYPGLRLGYLVAPEHLASSFAAALRKTGQDTPLILQAAMADFIESGQFTSHIRKMRLMYASRQARFVELANALLGDWLEVLPTDAGMQIACRFKRQIDEARLVESAAVRGIDIGLLSSYYIGRCSTPGLFLGYAGIPEGQMENDLFALKAAFLEVARS
ncbi:MAG: PLP-dependent aminotransferase family protein [Proteobacteria bacterium]|nr:PLP-dependent aminotransferase family protein [Pseudomonadota bacterium]MDA1302060.1 PLP-dependent aminotransferase family protein [Pseudomonadota bacterium]